MERTIDINALCAVSEFLTSRNIPYSVDLVNHHVVVPSEAGMICSPLILGLVSIMDRYPGSFTFYFSTNLNPAGELVIYW